jgi:hypothetical protein
MGIILKYALMKFDANMCKHRIYVPTNRDQLKHFVESVIKLNASYTRDIPGQLRECKVLEGTRQHRIHGLHTISFININSYKFILVSNLIDIKLHV